MNLTGKIFERRGLDGVEEISELVGLFLLPREQSSQDTESHQGILTAEDFRREYTQTLKSRGFTSIESIIIDPILSYFHKEFGKKYDIISSEIFDIERAVKVNVEERGEEIEKHDVEIPLFAQSEFGSREPWNFDTHYSSSDGYLYNVNFSADHPPYPTEINEKAREARANFLEVYAAALRKPFIGDLLMVPEEKITGFGNLELSTLWIPKASELNIEVERIDPDPLLIGSVYGINYLIAQWDVSGEEPYEHYLMEFKNIN